MLSVSLFTLFSVMVLLSFISALLTAFVSLVLVSLESWTFNVLTFVVGVTESV
jgi:hypothetical protein